MGGTLKELEKRLEQEPDNLPLRVTVAGMMSAAGRSADAVEHYRRVALAYRAQGRPQQALAVARNVLELAPRDAAIQALVTELTDPPTMPPPPPPEARSSSAEPPRSRILGKTGEPPPRGTPVPDELTDLEDLGAPRRSSFDVLTPLPTPLPYHLADPTVSRDKIAREGIAEVEALDKPGEPPRAAPPTGGGLAQAARRISSLIEPRTEKPTRSPFTPDPTLRPDAPPPPAPVRTAKPTVEPHADRPIGPRHKPGERPARETARQGSPAPLGEARARGVGKLPSILRPPSPPRPPPSRSSDLEPETITGQPPPTVRPRPASAPAALPAARDSAPARGRAARDTSDLDGRTTTRIPLDLGLVTGEIPRVLFEPIALPPITPPIAPRLPPRDTATPETGVDNLPPVPEPGADQLPPPPAPPPRAVTAIPRTPSYADEVVVELDTRERPRLSSEELDKIDGPPPTVPTEQIALEEITPTPRSPWPDRRARAGSALRDTPRDLPTDVHAALARDTRLDLAGDADAARDTRRDAASDPPEDERTAPRALLGAEPIANAFFLAIPPNRRAAALTRCIRRIVRPGQTVIRQSETSHPLYLVVTGQLALRVERANGTLRELDVIDAGQYIGESSLLARTPAIAHVIANADTELLALPPHALFELAGAYPALWSVLKETAERRARAYDKLIRGGG